jgi:hypothetical protein
LSKAPCVIHPTGAGSPSFSTAAAMRSLVAP